ncbi:hypothetical protein AAHE18_13G170600 [Arachis hypogaea]
MRGGYVRSGHSRSHEPHREEHGFRNAKKVRKGEGGQSFSGEVSLVPREEEWMIEGEERSQQGGQAKKLFCYAVKGGKTPVRVEEGDELSLSEDEEVEIEVMEEERNIDKPTEKKQGPEIRVEKNLFKCKIEGADLLVPTIFRTNVSPLA